MSTRATSIFKDPHVAKHLSHLHDKYVVVPVDKAPNNIVLVCKPHYIGDPDDTYERGNPGQLYVCFVFLEFQPK